MQTTTIVTDVTRPVPSNWPVPSGNAVLDAVLDRLELAAARLPMPLALPVMAAHAGLARIGYADLA